MRLEYCNEHSNCTIVDGEHTSRRPAVLPEGLVKQDQVDAYKKITNAKLGDLAVAIAERFKDSSQKIEDSHNTLEASIKDIKLAFAALQTEFYTFREDTTRRLAQALDEKKALPNRVATLDKKIDEANKRFYSVSDHLIKLDEGLVQETASREAQIRQLVEL